MATKRPGRMAGFLACAFCVGSFVVAGGLVLSPLPALSTSVVKLDDESLVMLSSTIVEGRVTNVSSAWNGDHTQIITTVTVKVNRSLKGGTPANGVLTLRLLGGRVGDIVMQLVGGPTFETDEDVILFVKGDGSGQMPITGLDQGKFTLTTDATTGQRMVSERGVTRDTFLQNIGNLVTEQEGGQ